jgi:hypothetical protein
MVDVLVEPGVKVSEKLFTLEIIESEEINYKQTFAAVILKLLVKASPAEDPGRSLLFKALERFPINNEAELREFCLDNLDRIHSLEEKFINSYSNGTIHPFGQAARSFFKALSLFMGNKVDFPIVNRTLHEVFATDQFTSSLQYPIQPYDTYPDLDQTWRILQEIDQTPISSTPESDANRLEMDQQEEVAINKLEEVLQTLNRLHGVNIEIDKQNLFIEQIEAIISELEAQNTTLKNEIQVTLSKLRNEKFEGARKSIESNLQELKNHSRAVADCIFELKKVSSLVQNGGAADQILNNLSDLVLILKGEYDYYVRFKTPEMQAARQAKWEAEQKPNVKDQFVNNSRDLPPLRYRNMATIRIREGVQKAMYLIMQEPYGAKILPLLSSLKLRLKAPEFTNLNAVFPNGQDYGLNNIGINMYSALVAFIKETFPTLVPIAPDYIASAVRDDSVDAEFYIYLFNNDVYLKKLLAFIEEYLIKNANWQNNDKDNKPRITKFLVDMALTIQGELSKGFAVEA